MKTRRKTKKKTKEIVLCAASEDERRGRPFKYGLPRQGQAPPRQRLSLAKVRPGAEEVCRGGPCNLNFFFGVVCFVLFYVFLSGIPQVEILHKALGY